MKEPQKPIVKTGRQIVPPFVFTNEAAKELVTLFDNLKNIRFPDEAARAKLEVPALKFRLAIASQISRLAREAKKAGGGKEQ